ncbi:3-(3-hydroxyphenyl)propionate hydroxylase, partial [Mycobacterium sp. CBMA361]|nr:3-(3-hydroxyphenyl)propionate hydroxylase [Mycolicibacterium sp. CBMA 361]
FDVLRGLHWTVLEFGGTAVDFGVPRVSLVPGADYDMPAGSYVLVRPDGHIATITDRPDVIWEQLRHFDPVGEPSLS